MEILLARLLFEFVEMHAPTVDAHGSARFHTVGADAPARNALREARHGWLGHSSARHGATSHVHQAVEEGAGGDHDAFRPKFHAPNRAHTHGHASNFIRISRRNWLHEQFFHLVLPNVQTIDSIERFAPFPHEFFAVALRARTPHGRPLAPIQHPKLNRRGIGNTPHFAAERIYLPDYLAFSNSSHGRIARHLRHLVHVHRDETRACAHACRRHSSLASCVAAADDNHVVVELHVQKFVYACKGINFQLNFENFSFINLAFSRFLTTFASKSVEKYGTSSPSPR